MKNFELPSSKRISDQDFALADMDEFFKTALISNPPEVSGGREFPKSKGTKVHIVKKGETLSGLAKMYGVSMQAIIDANNYEGGAWLKRDRSKNWIYTGERLRIPSRDVKSTYMMGDQIELAEGVIDIGNYYFAPDRDLPMTGISFKFTPADGSELSFDNSKYRWYQTVRTNEHYNSNYDYDAGYGPNVGVQFVDITDRIQKSGGPINYGNNGMYILDDLGRLMSEDYKVYWYAETSLLKINEDNEAEVLKTLTWGFTIDPGGTGHSEGLNETNSPTEFHVRMINGNVDQDYEEKL